MRNRYLTFAACFIAIILGISAFYILTQKKEQPVESADRLSICTSIYPIYDFTKNICGESADVFCIVPDGVDFRTWQPSENDISAICSSDIFIYSGKGAEPWLERILPAVSKTSVKLLNTSQNVSEESSTGYIWLNPDNAFIQMTSIYNMLKAEDPKNETVYKMNIDIFRDKTEKIKKKYKAELSEIRDKNIYVSAPIYDSLCNAYGLAQLTVDGIGYQGGVDPMKADNIRLFMESSGIKCIYTEPQNNTYSLKELVSFTKTSIGTLDPFIINLDNSGYFNIMEKNLLAIKKGQMPALSSDYNVTK